MKKLICMLTLLLSSVMSMSAQNYDLEGRWVADLSEGNDVGALVFMFEGSIAVHRIIIRILFIR